MRTEIFSILTAFLLVCGCNSGSRTEGTAAVSLDGTETESAEILPITGTFINLPYQDVRNKYTNPQHLDCTDPSLWTAKVAQMKKMGMEYLVFMSVANEEKSYYPSKLMDWHYPDWRKSPVDAIMDAAAEHGMKVFMSTGWAKDQDDNLRDPKIKGRQIEMMTELAGLYGEHPAFYGWYLPVEDCFGPVLTDYAVEAVNALTARARELTPFAKIMISPYGIFNSDFEDPRYEQQIARLTVDIIAYQDEIGCVRERYPLTRLRGNWKKLRAIHDKTGIEMWANCESFTWEKGTNDRTSALIPAAYSRLLAQQVAASAAGAEKIISFVMCGMYETGDSRYDLGQPVWSEEAGADYMDWLEGKGIWPMVADVMSGKYGPAATEDVSDPRWKKYSPGTAEIVLEYDKEKPEWIMVRMLNCAKDKVVPPQKIFLFASEDTEKWNLLEIKDTPAFPNTLHDAFIDHVIFTPSAKSRYLKLAFTNENDVMLEVIEKTI